jgi:hypothetical protein
VVFYGMRKRIPDDFSLWRPRGHLLLEHGPGGRKWRVRALRLRQDS